MVPDSDRWNLKVLALASIAMLCLQAACRSAGTQPPQQVSPDLTRPVASAPGSSAEEPAALTLRLSGLQDKGKIRVAVFNQADGFPSDTSAALLTKAAAADTTVELAIDNVVPGNYAVAVFQDLNDDGVLNKNPFGIPSEPYGFSNNAIGRFGPPSFADAALPFDGTRTIAEIQLK